MSEIDREERRNRAAIEEAAKLKKVVTVMSVAAVLLLVAVVWFGMKNRNYDKMLDENKLEILARVDSLKLTSAEIDTLFAQNEKLGANNAELKAQVDSSQAMIAELLENIQKTNASNLAKMRKYERELGTLRSIMRGYIVQIDSLNTLNQKLTVEARDARNQAAAANRRADEVARQNETLSAQVAQGSVMKARGLRLEAYNSSDKTTDRSGKVSYLMASISLVENDLVERGRKTVYIRVVDPAGNLLLGEHYSSFTSAGETMTCTASRDVDYEGAEVSLAIYVKGIPAYSKGVYSIEAYTTQGRVGTAEMVLR